MKLIETYYKTELGRSIEEYLIDTDAELASLPKAPVGSYAISVESGKKFFINSSGEWPDPSKYVENGGGGGSKPEGTITITENGTHDVTEYASAEVMVQSGDGYDVLNALIDGSITEITSNAESVDKYTFNGRSNLTSVNLPKATVIGEYAFEKCSNLTSVNLPLATMVYTCVFRTCKGLTSVNFPMVISIGEKAFQDCTGLTSVNLPLATQISGYAFTGCTGLTSVNLPLLTLIKTYTFNGCSSLTFLDFPMVTSISGTSVFKGSSKLTTIVLRSETVVTLSNVNSFDNTPFRGYNGLRGTFYVPQVLIEEYTTTATNWPALYAEGYCEFLPIEGSIYE